MKFKVGDKVRIKNLDWYNENKNHNGDIRNPLCFHKVMSKYCGMTATVTTVLGSYYYLDIDEKKFGWQDWMLEDEVETENKDVIEEIEVDKNVQSFINIANELCDLYEQKNKAYGNSFGDTYKKLGIISAVTRISDKYNRLCNLATNPNIDNLGESIEDTLKDLAAYSIMTLTELRNRREE